MHKLLLSGAALGLVSVLMGAMGDHALNIPPEKLHSLETAIRYNMLYAVLICALALTPPERKLALPTSLFAIGTAIFSFSIYAALISDIAQFTYLTPFGGLTLMTGWGSLLYTGIKNRRAID